MIDFHVHCDYSSDARGSAEEYAASALKNGLSAMCFTTHCDLDPKRRKFYCHVFLELGDFTREPVVDCSLEAFESYVRCREKVYELRLGEIRRSTSPVALRTTRKGPAANGGCGA